MQKNLEKIFEEKFSDFKMVPPKNLWINIEKQLLKAKIIKYSILSSIPLIVSILVFIYVLPVSKKEIAKNSFFSSFNISNVKTTVSTETPVIQEFIIKTNKATLKNNLISNKQDFYTNDITIIDSNKNLAVNVTNEFKGFEIENNDRCCPFYIYANNLEPNSKIITWKVNNYSLKDKNNIAYLIEKPGTYTLELTRNDNGIINIYSDSIIAYEKPVADFIIPENVFVNNQIVIENQSSSANKFTWLVNNKVVSTLQNPTYKFTNTGKQKITLICSNEKNCTDTISKELVVKTVKESIIFPNAIVPDLGGQSNGYYSITQNENTIFYPRVFKEVTTFQMTIYNKNGVVMFETNDYKKGWDGYYNNTVVDVGVYVYIAKVTFSDGESVTKNGSVTVIY
jgi:PKD repeat protein